MTAGPLLAATATATGAAQLAAGGVDRIVAYHSSYYRKRNLPSVAGLLPWASANEQTLEILPAVAGGSGDVPVIATVCASDRLLPVPEMLRRVSSLGATGVLNAPTLGLLTGPVREAIEDAGLGISAELELLRLAREHGLEAWAYVFDADWVSGAVRSDATGLIVHLGITSGSARIEPAVATLRECIQAVRHSGTSAPLLVHGGPLRTTADLGLLLRACGRSGERVDGFFGASAIESAPDIPAAVANWRRALAEHRSPGRIAEARQADKSGDPGAC